MLYVADFVWGGGGGGGSQTDSSAELFLNRYLPYNLQIMCVAFVRCCMVLDCESLIHLDFSSFFVIHVWHPRFFLKCNNEVLDLSFHKNKCFCMKRVQQNRKRSDRVRSSSFFRTESFSVPRAAMLVFVVYLRDVLQLLFMPDMPEGIPSMMLS